MNFHNRYQTHRHSLSVDSNAHLQAVIHFITWNSLSGIYSICIPLVNRIVKITTQVQSSIIGFVTMNLGYIFFLYYENDEMIKFQKTAQKVNKIEPLNYFPALQQYCHTHRLQIHAKSARGEYSSCLLPRKMLSIRGQKLVLKKTGNEMWKQSSQKWRQRFEDKKENFAYMCSQQRDWRSKVVTIRSKFFNCWSRWFNFARVTVSVGSRWFPRMFIRQNWNKEVQKPLPSRILPRNTFTPSRINTKKSWQCQCSTKQ